MGPRRKDREKRSKPSSIASAVHDTTEQETASSITKKTSLSLPLELQQLILNQFSRAFPFDSAAGPQAVIQDVKGHLYNRDFANAFGQPEYLEAYAVRWSASRALGYSDLLAGLDLVQAWNEPTLHDLSRHVVCIGGGAGAELAAFTAVIARKSRLVVTAIDIADWSRPLSQLQTALSSAPTLSQYASESARAANRPLADPANLELQFVQHDVLADWPASLLQERLPQADLLTIMFTLNELFSASIARTTKMLLELTQRMRPDAYLLVVDSPGSYAEISLGKPEDDGKGQEQSAASSTKQYPMKWLMDHTLMEVAKTKWEKVLEDDSRWFRVSQEVRYPIDLENMRYQMHLYKRLAA